MSRYIVGSQDRRLGTNWQQTVLDQPGVKFIGTVLGGQIRIDASDDAIKAVKDKWPELIVRDDPADRRQT